MAVSTVQSEPMCHIWLNDSHALDLFLKEQLRDKQPVRYYGTMEFNACGIWAD